MQDTGKPFSTEICNHVINCVEQVRSCQLSTGAIETSKVDYATPILKDAIDILYPYVNEFPCLSRCLRDMEEWLTEGLDSPPRMIHLVHEGMLTATEGTQDILFTVTNTQNFSDDPTLEFVWFRHSEGKPTAALRQIYPNDHVIIGDIIEATTGFGNKSNAAVTFTSLVAGGSNHPDKMAVFFLSKHARIVKGILQPLIEHVFTPIAFVELRAATLEQLYQIVPCKSFLHEYVHTQGALPLVGFRFLFGGPISGGLEEARVDLNVAYLLYKHLERGEPDFPSIYRMAAQYTISARLLRYAYVAHPSTNGDAVANQYCLGQFFAKDLLAFNAGRLDIAEDMKIVKGLEQILDEIRQLQYQVLVSSEKEAERIIQEHVSTYSRALDETHTMQHTVFSLWLNRTLSDIVPKTIFEAISH